MQINYQKMLSRLGALCVAGTTAFAGSVSYNFDTDPAGILSFYGNAAYVPTDGNPATGGYLSLTDAINSQRSFIVFDDFDNGLVVKAFSFSMDVRIGGGNSTPADGFSIDYVRASDPVLVDPASMNGWASNPGGEANLPEEGSTTGLGIGFDAYDSGNGDVIGISVRLDNVLIATYPLPNQNTTCDDPNSLQTGPIDPDNAGSPGLLCWQPFSVDLADTGKLVIKWKGKEITPAGGLQTTFVPSPGRLVLVARTGGLNQNQHIDNLKITTIASSTPTVGVISPSPAGFDFTILDAGADKVDSTTVAVKLNGTTVNPTVSKTGDTTSVHFNGFPTLIPSGSTNTLVVSFKDNFGNPLSVTRDYVQSTYSIVPPALALPAGATTTTPGFVIKSYQTAAGNNNSLALTQDELAGLLGANLADLSAADSNGFFHEPAVINYTKIPGTGDGQDGTQGNFGNETLIPGFPGSGPNDYDNAALEVTTYLKFPAAGVYTMGVSSDDGFRVTIADAPAEKLGGVILGQYNGGRGAGVPGTLFTFVVQQAGTYPARLIWENGGGGSSLEWFSVKSDGTYVLVNDTADPQAILAYQTSSVVAPYVDLVTPNADKIVEGQVVAPADPIRIELVDGTPATVNAGSIALSVNGTAASPTVTKTGKRTTLLVNNTFPNLLPAGSTNQLTLVYKDTATPANTYSNSWSFVVSKYATIPGSIALPIGSGDSTKPGFRIKTWQLDIFSPTVGTAGANQAQNLVAFAEQELHGLFGTNVADLTLADANGYFHETGVINYDIDPPSETGPMGNFGGEVTFPGIPGTPQYSKPLENFALEVQTYAEFPKAGLYTMGISSDDGFAVYPTTAPGSIFALNISSPAAIAGSMGAVSGGTDEGGLSKPLPVTPVTGKVVYANPAIADVNPLNNAAAIAGNIALIDRGTVTFAVKLQAALDAGAIGVIVVNNRDTNSADGILPIVMSGGSVNIPAVMVSFYDGQKIKDHLADAGGVTVSLGADPTTRLGFFNAGRGADSGTIFSFVVPQAGVYPLRSIFFQGGGGGNAEWFTVADDGTKILLNDTATAGAIKTYQAVTTVSSPTVSVSKNATEVILTFTGTLESSDTVNGTYTPVAGATSPLHVPFATAAAKFYRTRN
jgi:hypothetical protein